MRGQSTASSGNRASRLPLMLRDFGDRIGRLEKKRVYAAKTITIGDWRLSTDTSGALVATNIKTGSSTTLAP